LSQDPEAGAGSAGAAWPVVPGYEVLGELGRGGMGVVYKARQAKLQRLVALKMLRAGDCADENALVRFYREAEATGRMRHPNLVQVYEVGSHLGLPYLALELVEGGSLAEHLTGVPLPVRLAVTLTETLARAMHYAHARGIVHRDLKPANVLLQKLECGGPKEVEDAASAGLHATVPRITDFGLAKLLDAEVRLTRSGLVVGTPSYMAPEQVFPGRRPVGPEADVYALGAILYELLSGRPPFVGETPLDTAEQVVHSEPVPPRGLNIKIPRDVETITLKCLSKEPARRYPTAQALADDLQRWLDGKPIQARPVRRVERLWRWCHRNPVVAGMTAAAALFLLAGTTISSYFALKANERAREADEKAAEALASAAEARANLYTGHMILARAAWESGRLGRVLEYLDLYRTPQPGQGDPRRWEWYYQDRLCHMELHTLRGHTGTVLNAIFSPDGTRLASAGLDDGTVRVWDVASGQMLHILPAQTRTGGGMDFSPDGTRLASGCVDGTVKVWDAASGQMLRALQCHPEGVMGVGFRKDGTLISEGDGTVKVWDIASGQELRTFQKYTADVQCSPDGKRFAGAVAGGMVEVRDAGTGQVLLTLRGHTENVISLLWSPDGSRLASLSEAKTVKLWDAVSGQLLHTMKTTSVICVMFSPEGTRLALGCVDGTVKVWDAASVQELRSFQGHLDRVVSVSFSSDGTRLATASSDKTVKLWDVGSDQVVRSLKGDKERIVQLVFSPDGTQLASAGHDGTVRIWDAASNPVLRTFHGHAGWVRSVAFSPEGTRLASASLDKTIRIWDAASGQVLRIL
jgi:WD40 repeat protein